MNTASGGTRGWRDKVLDYTPFPDLPDIAKNGLRAWGLIPPWAHRHLRFYGVGHIVGGSIAATAGAVCLSYGVYGWAALFLVIATLNIAGGSWYLAVARSAPART
jgi:hypothetical protein